MTTTADKVTMFAVTMIIASASAVTASPVLAAEITANRFAPMKHPMVAGTILPWIDGVKKASNGKIKVTMPGASMAPAPRQWDIVAKGVADVAVTANVFQRKRLVAMQLPTLPFVTNDGESSSVALWRTYKKYFEPLNEYKGMKLLSTFVHSGTGIQTAEKPIRSVGDLTGVKIRTSPGATKLALEALGATVVTSPGIKIFEYVSKGTVDGLISTTGSINTYKIGRYIKYQTDFPGRLGNVSFSFFMNGKTWQGLTAEEKQAVENVSYEDLSRKGGKAWDDQDVAGLKDFETFKIERLQADPEFIAEAKKRLAFLRNNWIADMQKRGLANAAEAADFYIAEAKQLAK